jgi:cytosine/adenosine deaminase-related metal-dependent hydrolase
MDAIGFLSPRVCFEHGIWMTPSDMELVRDRGVTVVHNPVSNMKLGSGIAPIADYLERGVNVALGADGAASNNRLDGWEELRLAALLGNLRNGPSAIAAADLFELATVGGARALGIDVDIGSLEIGKYADVVLLDLRRAHAAGPDDVYTQLVYSARATDVQHVLIAGQTVVQKGKLTAFSEEEAVAEAGHQSAQVSRFKSAKTRPCSAGSA